MPVFDFSHWDKEQGDTLAETGPLIQVVLSMPEALAEFSRNQNLRVPLPISGYALIDTGASNTAVHGEILKELSVLPIDRIPHATPSGVGKAFVYPGQVSFPTLGIAELKMDRVVGCELKWQTSDGKEIIMLLGRDLLRHFLMIYNGPNSNVTLSY